jgi:hypothetical protein
VSCTRCGHEPTTVTKMDTMNILLTDAVCGEAVPAWVESVDELDAEIVRCETLGWRSGTGFEWVTELRQYRAAIDDQRDAVARRDTALAACGIEDPAGFAPESLDDVDDPAVMVWVEACAEVWGATELAEKARDAAVERADELAREAAAAHDWRDELADAYPDAPVDPSATPDVWLRWIVGSGVDGFESPEDPGVAVWVAEGRDAASLVVWATPRTWTEDVAGPVSVVLAEIHSRSTVAAER